MLAFDVTAECADGYYGAADVKAGPPHQGFDSGSANVKARGCVRWYSLMVNVQWKFCCAGNTSLLAYVFMLIYGCVLTPSSFIHAVL